MDLALRILGVAGIIGATVGLTRFPGFETGNIRYLLIPVFLAGVGVACLRITYGGKSRDIKQICLSSLLSLFVALYVFEWFFAMDKVRLEQNEAFAIAATAKRLGIPNDRRSKFEVIDDLRAKGVDAVPFVPFTFHLQPRDTNGQRISKHWIDDKEILPLNGIGGLRTIVGCNERGNWWTYPGDRFGYNNPDELWDSQHIQIVLVGDSFTHGSCVENDQNVPAVLRTRYPKTINLGWGGTGPLVYLATIREYAALVKPDVVLFMFFEGNDLIGMNKFKENPVLLRYLDGNFKQDLLSHRAELDRRTSDLVTEKRKTEETKGDKETDSYFLDDIDSLFVLRNTRHLLNLRRTKIPTGTLSTKAFIPDYDLFERILAVAKKDVASWGGKLYLVHLPFRPLQGDTYLNDVRSHVQKVTARLSIPVIDIVSHMAAESGLSRSAEQQYFDNRFSHYSEEGYRLVAEAVLSRLERDRVLSGGL
ncbi:MAG: hypothetical protein NPIRA02_16360 [Nitrospirales bacterium]|nr:MAG: hypothetical protein NPIRA02_16360 [Nitrospirales bacterium]